MSASSLICSRCHAQVILSPSPTVCPACGGELTAAPLSSIPETTQQPLETDHRGIVLPPRHAVGGIITPR